MAHVNITDTSSSEKVPIITQRATTKWKGLWKFFANFDSKCLIKKLPKWRIIHYSIIMMEDLTADVEESDLQDWQLPLAFMKKRHTERIEGSKTETHTWRMKERVSVNWNLQWFLRVVYLNIRSMLMIEVTFVLQVIKVPKLMGTAVYVFSRNVDFCWFVHHNHVHWLIDWL